MKCYLIMHAVFNQISTGTKRPIKRKSCATVLDHKTNRPPATN